MCVESEVVVVGDKHFICVFRIHGGDDDGCFVFVPR